MMAKKTSIMSMMIAKPLSDLPVAIRFERLYYKNYSLNNL